MTPPTKYALIVAGGSGKRLGNDIPKQFLNLAGEPLLFHTIRAFSLSSEDIKLIIVLHPAFIVFWEKLCLENDFTIPHSVIPGGAERFNSVSNALSLVEGKSLVAIHDAVRPLLSPAFIAKAYEIAAEFGTAVPVIPVRDTIRRISNDESSIVDRSELYTVQTPQVFRSEILKKAYKQSLIAAFTDDAAVVEKSGVKIHFFEGEAQNLKITYPGDLTLAEAILKNRT